MLPRSCWITEETDGAFATRRYFFYEKGIYYQLYQSAWEEQDSCEK